MTYLSKSAQPMEGVREYAEEMTVELVTADNGRLGICATNEGGHNCTVVDLLDVLEWLKANRPELVTP